MRWSHEPKPEIGQKRTITKFAWFPIRLGNETRWLEKVHIHQKFVPYYSDFFYDFCYDWINESFAESN